jgi:hypothetical protein
MFCMVHTSGETISATSVDPMLEVPKLIPKPGHPYSAGPCGAVRGTLAALHDLARRGDDVFEF